MRALIFNSGIGKRMGELTKSQPKSFARLSSGETVFERQIRLLRECGVKEFVITTGPFEEMFKAASKNFPDCNFVFVRNPVYDKTNYIYSMHLAAPYLTGDILMLHGDLVFSKNLASAILADPRPSIAAVDKTKPLPEKDFKALLMGGYIKEISVTLKEGYAFQPFYKLSAALLGRWKDKVAEFVSRGECGVYAENALNTLWPLELEAFCCEEHFVEEIDTPEDLSRVSAEIRQFDFDAQPITHGIDNFDFSELKGKKALIIGKTFAGEIAKKLDAAGAGHAVFDGFQANPTYKDAENGLKAYTREKCDLLISIGGGSAIDTAKGIKHFSGAPLYHIAIPTTAGTGSESTTFSVLYLNGEKQSVHHDSLFPDSVILEPRFLKTLSDYHKKSTLLDALCQAVESYWSVRANEKSRRYAKEAISLIRQNTEGYLKNDLAALSALLTAANLSGKAINISQTTAAHAMSYKITSLFGTAHGYAVALTLPYIWEYMKKAPSVRQTLSELDGLFDGDGVSEIKKLIKSFNLPPIKATAAEFVILTVSVNADRLKNNPVQLDMQTIRDIYKKALK